MAHFAQINENNVVLKVIVISNNDCQIDGVELESKGIAFCQNLFGGNWVQTSYNATIRKNYAGVGFTYDSILDAFIPPKLFPSWLLNETTCLWDAPTPYPNDGKPYRWDEPTTSWIEIIV